MPLTAALVSKFAEDVLLPHNPRYPDAMTTPLAETLAQVATLNDPAEPFTYEVQGNEILAKWDIVRAQTLYPAEFATIDKSYSITVSFNEDKGTFRTNEKQKSTASSFGTGGFSVGTSGFSGKTTQKEFSIEIGGVSKTADGITPILAYSFETSRIKEPLLAFLEKHGWKRKRGLFG